MKLISMTSFVLEQSEYIKSDMIGYGEFIDKVINYAKFLNKPLKLSYFIPTDENGNVLEEPLKEDYEIESDGFSIVYDAETYEYNVSKYSDAKERVLFEGFNIINNNTIENDWCKIEFINFKNGNTSFVLQDYSEEELPIHKVKTIEDLIIVFNLNLTPSALKQIGL